MGGWRRRDLTSGGGLWAAPQKKHRPAKQRGSVFAFVSTSKLDFIHLEVL